MTNLSRIAVCRSDNFGDLCLNSQSASSVSLGRFSHMRVSACSIEPRTESSLSPKVSSRLPTAPKVEKLIFGEPNRNMSVKRLWFFHDFIGVTLVIVHYFHCIKQIKLHICRHFWANNRFPIRQINYFSYVLSRYVVKVELMSKWNRTKKKQL